MPAELGYGRHAQGKGVQWRNRCNVGHKLLHALAESRSCVCEVGLCLERQLDATSVKLLQFRKTWIAGGLFLQNCMMVVVVTRGLVTGSEQHLQDGSLAACRS